ncbi:unnamed protein product [Symbiodinium sp. CCMP2592]|nr:unnamed protein product [Symbiodinium sp. CCMP2592]
MGCSSSASPVHDDLEDTSLTRVIFTDAAGRKFVEHSAPFKEGLRRFSSMRISDGDASAIGIKVPLASTHNRHVREQLACNISKCVESESKFLGTVFHVLL